MAKTPKNVDDSAEEPVVVQIVETPAEEGPALRPETIAEMEAGKAALARYQKA